MPRTEWYAMEADSGAMPWGDAHPRGDRGEGLHLVAEAARLLRAWSEPDKKLFTPRANNFVRSMAIALETAYDELAR